MQAILEIGRLIVSSVGEFARQPELLIIGAIVIWLVYRQYVRMAMIEARLLGVVRTHPREHTLTSLGAGAIGGVFATVLFVILGLPLDGVSLIYLWLVAIILMFFHPRFICFSYAGGLIGLASLLGLSAHVNIAAIMALIAALHLLESVLITLTGAEGAIPVYVKAPSDRIVGGFLMQRYWPIPFLALVATVLTPEMMAAAANFSTPAWWPLFGAIQGSHTGEEWVYFVLPVMAALGYSDFTLTRTPQRKARATAIMLGGYSVVLLVLAFLAQYSIVWAWLATLWAPVGHELVIWQGRKSELQGKPVYVQERGAMVLSVLPGFPAHTMGLRSGDIIRKVNGTPVKSRTEFAKAVAPWLVGVELEVEQAEGGQMRTIKYKGKIPPLGLQFVPVQTDMHFVNPMATSPGIIVRLWRQWMQRLKRLKGKKDE